MVEVLQTRTHEKRFIFMKLLLTHPFFTLTPHLAGMVFYFYP